MGSLRLPLCERQGSADPAAGCFYVTPGPLPASAATTAPPRFAGSSRWHNITLQDDMARARTHSYSCLLLVVSSLIHSRTRNSPVRLAPLGNLSVLDSPLSVLSFVRVLARLLSSVFVAQKSTRFPAVQSLQQGLWAAL